MVRVDNEYTQYGLGEPAAKYFEQLEDAYRKSDIDVPLTYNDPGQLKNFVNGTVRLSSPADFKVTKDVCMVGRG